MEDVPELAILSLLKFPEVCCPFTGGVARFCLLHPRPCQNSICVSYFSEMFIFILFFFAGLSNLDERSIFSVFYLFPVECLIESCSYVLEVKGRFEQVEILWLS